MKILVTGATGNVGGEVVRSLHKRGSEVRAMARKPESVSFPSGVEVVAGDLTDLEGYVERGFASTDAEVSRVTKLIGHAPRTYEAFVQEAAASWRKSEQR